MNLPFVRHSANMLATNNYLDFQILEPITQRVLTEWSGAAKANHALPEDKVQLSTEGLVEIIEAAPRKPLVGILQLTSKYMYGMTGRGVPIYLCETMNKGYPSFRVACKERDRSKNLLVSFQYESWDQGAELPRGGLLTILGPVEDPGAEAEAVAILSCPWSAPRPLAVGEFIEGDRRILSSGTFNIDPLGCNDIDDVLTFQRNEDDTVRFWITIADVTETVDQKSNLWDAARKIGATSYQAGRAVRPMLHKDLSEKALSLLPGERRYGLALCVDWSKEEGFLKKPFFEKVLVVNQNRYTYETIGMADTWILATMEGIASTLAGRRVTDSHEWIEQFMLFYNREAAQILKLAGIGLLRIHDEPFEEKRKALLAIDPRLEHLAYQAATYAPVGTGGGHWGLSLETYCHASSPIRRFADLVNQQIIKDWLDQRESSYSSSTLDELATWLNRRQKQIAAGERDFAFLQAIQESSSNSVRGVVLWKEQEKYIIYVDAWKTSVRFKDVSRELTPGQNVELQYYCDRRKAKWKDRMILSLV